MRVLTYYDYLEINNIFYNSKNGIFTLFEESEKYNLEQPHDKLFKEILDNKQEAVNFLNKTLKLKKEDEISKEQIEKYNRNFITKEFKNLEADIIYKIKNQNVFFLIEHQSTIDYSMPYRILRYGFEIIQSAIDVTKIKNKEYKLPTVFSFVIYTGRKKWDANNYIEEKQEKFKNLRTMALSNFKLIDVNELKDEELIESQDLLYKAMYLEKAKNIQQLQIHAQEILDQTHNEEQRKFLIRAVNYIFKNKINPEKLEEFNKIKMKGEKIMIEKVIEDWVNEMNAWEEKNRKAEEKLRKEKIRLAKNLLDLNINLIDIKKATNLSEKEILALAK